MLIQLLRLQDNGNSTIGTIHLNGTFEAFSLEDTKNEPKIYGSTRIPSGEYEIKLRTEGMMNKTYSKRFGDVHKGMLWLQDVPNFKWVYLHIGNTHEDTDGCILIGTTCDSTYKRQTVAGSALKYNKTYKKIVEALERDEEVTIQII